VTFPELSFSVNNAAELMWIGGFKTKYRFTLLKFKKSKVSKK
jgi:hypothetical protein